MIRFDSKFRVDPQSGCWLWTACVNHKGYGRFGLRGKVRLAHRVSYEMHCGAIPPGKYVLHSCDTPACVNPAHLWVGSAKDNAVDRDLKGRRPAPKGALNGNSKLSQPLVDAILAASGSQSQIARQVGLSQATVSRVKRGVAAW